MSPTIIKDNTVEDNGQLAGRDIINGDVTNYRFFSLFGTSGNTPKQPREGKDKGIIFSSGWWMIDIAIWFVIIWYVVPYVIYILAPQTTNIQDHYTPLLSAVVILFNIVAIKTFSSYKKQALAYQTYIDAQIKKHEALDETHKIEPFSAETHTLNAKINIWSVTISTNLFFVLYLFGDGRKLAATMLAIIIAMAFAGLIWGELKREAKVSTIIGSVSAYRKTTKGKFLLTLALLLMGAGLLLLYRYLLQ